jgi:hypothetical protein
MKIQIFHHAKILSSSKPSTSNQNASSYYNSITKTIARETKREAKEKPKDAQPNGTKTSPPPPPKREKKLVPLMVAQYLISRFQHKPNGPRRWC